MKYSKCLTVLLSILTALFILSISISVPILFRTFYYLQIDSLELETKADLSREQIVTAFDEMMDFCIGETEEFSTGALKWSESGKAHFTDVRSLFLLDLKIAMVSGSLLLVWKLIKKKGRIQQYRFLGFGSGFWGSMVLAVVFLIVGVLGALDFDRAFTIFHMLFFPGKDNWVFDYNTDQIIGILPEEFFQNCAILVLLLITLFCMLFISADLWQSRKNNISLQKKGELS